MNKTEELQNDIKALLARIALSIKDASSLIYEREHGENDCAPDYDEGERKFQEAFKKQLDRPKTPPELLSKYLRWLTEDPRAVSTNLVLPISMKDHNSLPSSCNAELEVVSGDLDDLLEHRARQHSNQF